MTRRQLSLYVPVAASKAIEAVRVLVDPVQHRLIPAHVTLCREDELLDLHSVEDRLSTISFAPITLTFGPAEVFFDHGILLPCVSGESAFRALRQTILGRSDIKDQPPHMTLAHPRNPRAPGNSLTAALRLLPGNVTLTFATVHRIEQPQAAQPWRVLATYPLNA